MTARRAAALLALALGIAAHPAAPRAAPAAAPESFSFALIGDAPYWPEEEARFVAMLGELDREELAFIAHVGDFKHGSSPCSDEVFAERRAWFAASRHAFIYLPGDNEWTDCWRPAAGGYDPLERLAKLRALFFAGNASLGLNPLALERQSASAEPPQHPYPEHVRWVVGEVLFAGFNVPGGGNNLARDPSEFHRRDAAVREWLRQAFALARAKRLKAVVLLMQANPWAGSPRQRAGYTGLLRVLTAETLEFDGQVLLVHGDTHRFRVDKPLLHPDTREPVERFSRVEVFGSPDVNWVRVGVRRKDREFEFEVSPGRGPELPPSGGE